MSESKLTRADVDKMLEGVTDALGRKIGAQLADNRKASEERARKLEEMMKAQDDELKRIAADRSTVTVDGRSMSMGVTMRHDQSPEEAIDDLRRSTRPVVYGDGVGRAKIGNGDTRGILAVRLARALAIADARREGHEGALRIAKSWEDKTLAGLVEENRDLVHKFEGSDVVEKRAAVRALGTDTLAGGGAAVQVELASQFLDILHARTLVRALGAMTLPMPTGAMEIPFFDSGATASWQGENAGPNATSVTHGRLSWQRRILRALVPVSNQLLNESSYAYDALLRDHLINQLKKKEDLGFIRGDGQQNAPYGISYWADLQSHSSNRTQADTAGSTAVEITADLCTMLAALEGSDVAMVRLAFMSSVRDKYGLFRLRDANNNLIFADEIKAGTLMGAAFDATSQIPTNLDTSGLGDNDESEFYLADLSTCAIAETNALNVQEHRYGAYKNSAGTVVSGITDDQTVFDAKTEVDFAPLHRGKEVYRLDRVDWGA